MKSTLELMIIMHYNYEHERYIGINDIMHDYYKYEKYSRINYHSALLPVPERSTHWLQEQPISVLIYPVSISPSQSIGTGFSAPSSPTIYHKILFSNYQMPIYVIKS